MSQLSQKKQVDLQAITEMTEYKRLIAMRGRIIWSLFAVIVLVYLSFIMAIAFFPDFLSQPLTTSTVTTVGIVIGLAVILACFAITGIYVHQTNTRIEPLIHKIQAQVEDKDHEK